MPKPIQISIPTPCHEKWAEMAPADKGRFCSSCQKNVIDFTKVSDREIAAVFKKQGSLCGRFRKDQLERDLVIPKEKSSLWAAASAAVISFLTLGSNEILAQEPVSTEKIDLKTNGKTLKGFVSDKIGSLPGVFIENITTKKNTSSDITGNFDIEVKKGDILKFSLNQYLPQEITVTDTLYIAVELIEDSNNKPITKTITRPKTITYTTGVVITTTEIIEDRKNRTFFGRMFHSIGNWFR